MSAFGPLVDTGPLRADFYFQPKVYWAWVQLDEQRYSRNETPCTLSVTSARVEIFPRRYYEVYAARCDSWRFGSACQLIPEHIIAGRYGRRISRDGRGT